MTRTVAAADAMTTEGGPLGEFRHFPFDTGLIASPRRAARYASPERRPPTEAAARY